MVLYLLGTGIFFANIWGPLVIIGNAGDMVIDQVISLLIHAVPMIIPVVNCIMAPATICYLLPVATINITDRNLKQAKRDGSWKGKGAANTILEPAEQELAMAF